MTNTYTPLATLTLTGGDSSITFASIPSTYRDLIIVCNFQMSGTSSASRLQVNLDGGANYSGVSMVGNGSGSGSSGAESGQTSARIFGASQGPSNTYNNVGIIQLMDYSATDKHKTILTRYGASTTDVQAQASRWASNTAINSVTIFDVLGQTYQAGSTFSLYGVVA
jgi:hypothetical protein